MSNKYEALQGKMFFVELQSMLGSTNYGWCVKSMPEQIVLIGSENLPMSPGIAPVRQRYYFAAVSAEEVNVEIEFILVCLSNFADVSDTFKAEVQIIPSNAGDFVSADTEAVRPTLMYGIVYRGKDLDVEAQDANQKYGYPCGVQDANLKYGYFCDAQNANYKYGYPCGVQDANLKYGYFCDAQNANYKYGYPCGVQDANLKYGYFCDAQNANYKYGYPCGVQDANLKYGYFCDAQNANYKYGYPCGVQDAIQKYGYPCGVQNAQMPYGYTMDARPYGLVYSN